MKAKEIIGEFTKLDLSAYPYKEINDLLKQMPKVVVIQFSLHKGKTIIRGRPNYNNEIFCSKSELTFKPNEFNKTYQRASTPDMTMFYASLVPERKGFGDLDNSIVISIMEGLPWLRDKTSQGFQKITFGKWIVKEDINLLAVLQHEAFYSASSLTKEIIDDFKQNVKENSELEEETMLISGFFAKEFSKGDISNDYDYLFSAIYTEWAVKIGFDGVFYPSVRTEGKGFNIALTPDVANNKLDLVGVGECSIYKLQEKIVVDNETVVELSPNQTKFKLLPIDFKHHFGETECLRRLGLKTMDELIKK